MANGGIIGPVITPAAFNQSEQITTFNSTGIFTKQTYTNQVDVLLVAGGGGGASHFSPGGGGGGVREIADHPCADTEVTVTVGAGANGSGGSPSPFPPQNTAGNSTFATSSSPISSTGGGNSSVAGGCGGGGFNSDSVSANTPGAARPGNAGGYNPVEGFDGGIGSPGNNPGAKGGGGGAGAVSASILFSIFFV